MSTANEITRLGNAKSAIAAAIKNKGVTVPATTKLDGMAALIGQIQTGGGLKTSTISGLGSAVGGTVYYIDANGQGQQYEATEWPTFKAIKGSYIIVDFAYAADGFYLDGFELVAGYGPFATSANDGANNYVVILKITGDNPIAMI